jgi:hypothetical protein
LRDESYPSFEYSLVPDVSCSAVDPAVDDVLSAVDHVVDDVLADHELHEPLSYLLLLCTLLLLMLMLSMASHQSPSNLWSLLCWRHVVSGAPSVAYNPSGIQAVVGSPDVTVDY